MALVEQDLRLWLLDQGDIEDLVKDQVHAVILPQPPKLPAIVISLVSSSAAMSTTRYSRLRVRRFQLDLYSNKVEEVFALGETVFRTLVGFAGMMGDTHVQLARLLSERDLHEPDVKLFRRIQDWEIGETG